MKHVTTTIALLLGAALLSSCGAGSSPEAPSAAAGGVSAVTVKSCDEDLKLAAPPTKVLLMGDTDASILLGLGVMDRVTARAGHVPQGAYSSADYDKLQSLREIPTDKLDNGGAKLATEVVLNERPDLVIGYDTGLDREALRKAGIPVYSPDAFCTGYAVKKASFDLVGEEITKIGAIFGVSERASVLKDRMADELRTLAKRDEGGATAVALYITPGETTFYAYGASSMVQPILEVNGLTNVYADQSKRVFDASMESLLATNPDRVILLWGDGTAEQARATFLGFRGVDKMKAVRSGNVVTLPFSLTDPPTMLSVQGAAQLHAALAR